MKFKEFNKLFILILILSSLFNGKAYGGNDNKSNAGYWFILGIGASNFGPTFKISASYVYNDNLFSVRYMKADELRFSPGGSHVFDNPALSFKEIGVFYGRTARKKYILFSLLGGIAYITGIDRGILISEKEYEKIKISSLSFPLEVNVRLEVSQNIGFGISFFGNINSKKFFTGGLIEVSIGKFYK